MKALIALALASTLGLSGAAFASAELVTKHKCQTCHSPDKKMMGPTWKTIADKHKGQKDAEKVVADAIVKGSKGVYGKVPMPPQPKAKDDAAALAKFILGH